MARYCGGVCRFCRRQGEKLFLKGERCFTEKCAMERREGAPGQHGRGRQSFSDYKVRLRERQKAKRIYGLLERKFEVYYEDAARAKGVTGSRLLLNLERRLDNVVYRLGFAMSRNQARQIVKHGHVLVNGKSVDLPAFPVSAGDTIEIKEKSKKNVNVVAAMESATSRMIPEWLALDKAGVKGSVLALPTREQLPQSVNEQLIVEWYSR